MNSFLMVLAFFVSTFALAESEKFPNDDALTYWNRALEFRDELLRTRKELGEVQIDYESKLVLFEMRKKLFEKAVVSEEEYREYLWQKEQAEIKIEQIRKKILSEEIYEQISMLRYEQAKKPSPNYLQTYANYQAEQWKNRIELARLDLQQAEAELRFRDFQWTIGEKLVKTGAVTQEKHLLTTQTRNVAQQNQLLATQRIALAELAYKEAVDAAAMMKPAPPANPPSPNPPPSRRR